MACGLVGEGGGEGRRDEQNFGGGEENVGDARAKQPLRHQPPAWVVSSGSSSLWWWR